MAWVRGRAGVGVVIVFALAGCVKKVVPCPNDGGVGPRDAGAMCPNSDVGLCRAEQLRESEGACVTDTDCRLARLPANCAGYAQCHAVSVNRLTGTRFENEVLPLIEAACGTVRCEVEGLCPTELPRSVCRDGVCEVKIVDFDAGFAGGVDECDLVDPIFYCPHEENERCRLERIRQSKARCTTAAECTLVHVSQNCVSYGDCSAIAVTVAESDAFRAEAEASLSAYCASIACRSSGTCIPFTAVDCAQGLCRPGFADGG